MGSNIMAREQKVIGGPSRSVHVTNGYISAAPVGIGGSATSDFLTQVKLGEIDGCRLVHKFGKNDAVGTSPAPVAIGGVYQTPAANASLEILSDDTDDDITGDGARKVTIQGLVLSGGLFIPQQEEVEMGGTDVVALSNQYIRVFRAWISESGTYATPTAVSSPGTITIRGASGGVTWLQIAEFATGNSAGQSQVALYTTPSNTTSVLYAPIFTIEATKNVDVFMFSRPNADDVTPPFTGARRVIQEWLGLQIPDGTQFMAPVAAFSGAVDIGFMAQVDLNTARVSAEFWLLEIDN